MYHSSLSRNYKTLKGKHSRTINDINQSKILSDPPPKVTNKNIYNILTHIYKILKNDTQELIYRAAVEKQT